ncbi:alpha/beta fold hydrolase [Amycolatopsis sp. FDAARGOS 1241]|uniref:alpha/beta fold hydrolase n=1 Tax=Amycolatopsis sp. FDAARGOS 1241 TaxID=2778070 RepID=UPI0019511394|nr:alpha/beta hydrolase [Amycolatopsis sp. FDAARGOS 1241]QRP48648.1 alpha/beta hydrolase [Amycolatopsis sp. FDAARGOS 1241]
MRTRTGLTQAASVTAVLAAAAVFAAVPSSAASREPARKDKGTSKPTIVLVHGAFADSSSWNGAIERLQRRGYSVIAAANPLRGVASDGAYVKTVVDSVDGPVVLVGHSYGGSVISAAAVDDPKVKALVYIAGFIPDQGESAAALSAKFPGSTLGDTLREVALPGGETDLYVKQDLFRQQFAADVPLPQARLMAAGQRPITAEALNEASGVPGWRGVPVWSLIPTADKNIPAAAQEWMAERARAHTVVVPEASHAVLVSRPDEVADIILRAAEAVVD